MKTQWLAREMITGPYLALVLSEKAFLKAMKECKISKSEAGVWLKTPTADATAHIFEHTTGDLMCVVALKVGKDTTMDQVIGLLVHEAVHIWQHFKRRIGEAAPSDEFEAYSIQTISQRLIASYLAQTKKG